MVVSRRERVTGSIGAAPGMPIAQAYALLERHRGSTLPVVSVEGRLLGILTPHGFPRPGLHHMPMLDDAGRVIGMLIQADLIAALYRTQMEMPGAQASAA